jgi:pimeloyl-ACP methyl ester carboxylesterase
MTPEARPRLLLIHGLLGSLNYFEPRRYLPGVDVLTPDLTGYGQRRSEETDITLPGQAALLARFLRDEAAGPAWVLGHSVGGAVAMLLADMAPDLVRGLISVEGNFTLKDAFWTGRIAALADAEWAAEYGAMEAAPAAWLEKSGIEASDERIAWARDILANQPYTTVQTMAQSVLDTTGAPDYLACVGRVLARATPPQYSSRSIPLAVFLFISSAANSRPPAGTYPTGCSCRRAACASSRRRGT